jgi:membrane-associated phospholipid phosphatase
MSVDTRAGHLRSQGAWQQVILAGAVLLGVFVGLAGMLAILGLALVGRHGGGTIQHWDNTVQSWFVHHRFHLVTVSKVIAKLLDAGPLGAIVIAITAVLLLLRQQMRALIPLAAYLGGEALVFLTRVYMHRPRPLSANYPGPDAIPGVHETSWSFPSGHATGAAAVLVCLGGLAAVHWRVRWPWALGALAALFVGATRLVLGVHWFSDVAFGLIAGIPWGVAVTVVLADLGWPVGWLARRE